MEEYEELEEKCCELKAYTRRVMDLYCDGKKWHWLAEKSTDEATKTKYMTISNTLMDLFNKEVEEMRLK